MVPRERITPCNGNKPNPAGKYVLYWMISFRRLSWNYSLQRAVEWSGRLGKPLVILEALRCDYPWASDRIHLFVLQGMAQNQRALERKGVLYYPYLEPKPGAGRGLLEALAREACVVVTDEFPAFFLPHMVAAAATKVRILLEKVDSNGILPLRSAPGFFRSAHSFRRFLHSVLLSQIQDGPQEDPLATLPSCVGKAILPATVVQLWPPLNALQLKNAGGLLGHLPIDHSVAPVPFEGGENQAKEKLEDFLLRGLPRYALERDHPDSQATSGLSAYLHFGHISPHHVMSRVLEAGGWKPEMIQKRAAGSRRGWWGLDHNAEAFLDQLLTWRELGFNACFHTEDHHSLKSLPAWALRSLEEGTRDPRRYLYGLEELQQARTHDRVWNAAQRELLCHGRIHNYMRMLWGKGILQWTPDPETALDIMIHLNNLLALDGRDPNSYSGILWCMGKYDRPWGPRRPVLGTVRYMSSENALRKLRMRKYLETWSSPAET